MAAKIATFALGAGLLLSACAGGGSGNFGVSDTSSSLPSSAWKIDRKRDRLTDRVGVSASVLSTNAKITSNLGRFNAAVVSISCISNSPTVMIHFGWPIGRDGIAVASYRADERPAQSPNIKFIGTEAFIIEGQGARTFIEEVSNASSLYVQVSATTGNQATADFKISGANEAIGQVINECPFPPSVRAPSKKR